MSTLQTIERTAPSRRTTLTASLAMIGVLVAIAVVVVILASGSTSHVSQPTPVVTNADTSAAYTKAALYDALSQTPVPTAIPVTANNQDSAAYTKAARYNAAR
jgi:hypothetical protein